MRGEKMKTESVNNKHQKTGACAGVFIGDGTIEICDGSKFYNFELISVEDAETGEREERKRLTMLEIDSIVRTIIEVVEARKE
jgi:hypothetical protein